MLLNDQVAQKIYERADLCRRFEEECYRQVEKKNIAIPVYLSAGQEYISATLSVILESLGILDRQIFIQHRGHSTYLSFGGNLDELILELLGMPDGCANGMGGSASIHSLDADIYGHDGLMGSHGPIAVGMAYGNKKPTICFTGDAAAEEDYFLASIGWAATKNLPIIFVVEDNNLSILTEKKVRRSWEMHDVARGFGMEAFDCDDDPESIYSCLNSASPLFSYPILLNLRTNRMFWHAGAGIDSDEIFDRHEEFGKRFSMDYREQVKNRNQTIIETAWKKNLSH
jgi:TPP-dependent pyruvate/acetoin dehydrogenase alpha subunit